MGSHCIAQADLKLVNLLASQILGLLAALASFMSKARVIWEGTSDEKINLPD